MACSDGRCRTRPCLDCRAPNLHRGGVARRSLHLDGIGGARQMRFTTRWVCALHSSPIIHASASASGTPEYVPLFHHGWF